MPHLALWEPYSHCTAADPLMASAHLIWIILFGHFVLTLLKLIQRLVFSHTSNRVMLVCGLVHHFGPHWGISTTIRWIVMQVWGPLTFAPLIVGSCGSGRWFNSPGLHVEVSLDKTLNPKTAPDVPVCTLHGDHRHQCKNVCMNYCKLLWTKASAKWP